ncbi:MAG: hypothetical protein MJZ74_02930 [Muribaculaceae bacterium]|nr:hypothetical protein [Muribaculaceae bacterium]
MSKKLLTLMLVVMAAIAMTSCGKDDPTPQYTYYKPCTAWGATPAQVDAFMATSPGWVQTTSMGSTVFYKNEGTNTAVIYAFSDGILAASVVTVSGFNTQYDNYKAQIASDYGMTFEDKTLMDLAINPQQMMGVAMHRFSTYMTAAYFHIGLLDKLKIDPNDVAAIQALIDKIKAGLLPPAQS